MTTFRRTRTVSALSIAAGCGATLVAWQTPQTPVFRDATEMVRVEFLAMSKTGDPVRDLGPADLSVRMNGRDRSIASLQFVGLDDTARRGSGSADVLAPAFGTNSASEQGRSILLLLDDDSIGPGDEERVREAVDHLLEAIGPRDRRR
jgi:hypothetical protein